MDKIKVAIIGAGNISNSHIDAYKKLDNVEVYAICDISEERLNKTADKYGIERRYTDLDKMLAELPELDAASVCVWNCNHAECAIKALNAGLNVICEKPMAYNAELAQQMKDAADRSGKLLMIGFCMRFSSEAKIARDFIENGYLGDVYFTKAQYVRKHGNPGGWFCDKERSGGGPIIDLGVHVLDFARYLMGNPKPLSVYAVSFDKLGNRENIKNNVGWIAADHVDGEKCDVEDFAAAFIRYDNGAVTNLETSYDFNGEESYKNQLFGTKAGIDIAEDGGVKLYGTYNDYLADINVDTANYKFASSEFDGEIAHFIDCIVNGTKCIAPAEDGIVIMKILDAIYESARVGHEVAIEL